MSQFPFIYILILNYCSVDDTLECVRTIKQQDYPNYRVIVLDNASPDGSAKVLGRSLPSDMLIELKRNLGYAGGNNVGLRKALTEGADYVLIVNPDVRLPPHALSSYVQIMTSNTELGALNPIQLDHDGKDFDIRFRRYVLGGINIEQPLSVLLEQEPFHLWHTKQLFGACLMLSREALERVGGFDPLYFAYGEEVDLCRRIRYHKLGLAVTNRAPVIHLRTNERAGHSDRCLFLRIKGNYLNDLKNPYRNIRLSMRDVVQEFWNDFTGKNRHEFPWRWHHYVRAACWLAFNIREVRNHRRAERQGSAHL